MCFFFHLLARVLWQVDPKRLLACICDRPKPSHGPLLGHAVAKKGVHLGLCPAKFNPDPRKIWSGLPSAMPRPCWAYRLLSWGYDGSNLKQLAHPLLRIYFALFIEKDGLKHHFAKRGESQTNISVGYCFDCAKQHRMETKKHERKPYIYN